MDWGPERQAAVRAGWQVFQRQLHVHHRGEDAVVWPLLRERLAGRTGQACGCAGHLADGDAPARQRDLPAAVRPSRPLVAAPCDRMWGSALGQQCATVFPPAAMTLITQAAISRGS
jgi:hypothetical protein